MAETARLTLGRSKRLKAAAEFERVKIEGESVRGALLMLGVLKTDGGSGVRFGFVTSRRTGGAVVRNRIRRRLRDVARRHQYELRAGILVVTIARAAAADASYVELEHEWLRLASRASILSA